MQTIRENLCIKAIYSNPKSNVQKQDPRLRKSFRGSADYNSHKSNRIAIAVLFDL